MGVGSGRVRGMRCPRCQFDSPVVDECLKCGIVFEKWEALQEEEEFEELATGVQLEVAETAGDSPVGKATVLLPMGFSPSRQERINLFRSLANLLVSGISPFESLEIVRPTLTRRLQAIIADLGDKLQGGAGFSDALSGYGDVFETRLLADLRAAERTGHLHAAFERAADRLEAQRDFRRALFKKQWSLMVSLLIGIFLLPVPQALLTPSSSYWSEVLWPLGTLAALFFILPRGLKWAIRHTPLGHGLKRAAWAMPWPGTIYVSWIRAHFLDDLSLHLHTGHSMSQALDSALDVAEDPRLHQRVNRSLQQGDLKLSLTTVLASANVVAAVDHVQVITGERSGTLVASLATLATHYRDHFARNLQRLLNVLQTGLILSVLLYLGYTTLKAYETTQSQANELQKALDQEMDRLYKPLRGAGGRDALSPGHRPLSPRN